MNIDKFVYFSRKYPKRGEIWIVDLGRNRGSEQNGVRPVIVLNKPKKKERTCVVIPVSNTKREFSFKLSGYQFLIHQIRVVDTSRFSRKLKLFSPEDTHKVYEKVCEFLS